MEDGFFIQPVSNRSNYKLAFVFVLKNTFAVAKLAIIYQKILHYSVLYMKSFQLIKYIFYFHAISPYVLHRGCTVVSRDQRKVFYPCIIIIEAVQHKAVPVLSCPRFYKYMIIIFFDDFDTFYF